METIFVYGTLKESEVQKNVIGRVAQITPNILQGHDLSSIVINNNTYWIAKIGLGLIAGYTYKVSKEELLKIDEYETTAYKRKLVKLKNGQQAWVYCK
jgi:gamma-glutamylcyclotransferase (GGCT)/AIG2-like uncharacterized protein YtfP